MSTKRERDEIKLDKAHLKEHKAIAVRIAHLENAVGILNERLDEMDPGEECKPKNDIKYDVLILCRGFDEYLKEFFFSQDKKLTGICGQDLIDIIEIATKEKGTEVHISRAK